MKCHSKLEILTCENGFAVYFDGEVTFIKMCEMKRALRPLLEQKKEALNVDTDLQG